MFYEAKNFLETADKETLHIIVCIMGLKPSP